MNVAQTTITADLQTYNGCMSQYISDAYK